MYTWHLKKKKIHLQLCSEIEMLASSDPDSFFS